MKHKLFTKQMARKMARTEKQCKRAARALSVFVGICLKIRDAVENKKTAAEMSPTKKTQLWKKKHN